MLRQLVEIGRNSVCHLRGAPRYGHQDVGIAPGGALDRCALVTGNLLLGNPDQAEAVELLYPSQIRFLQPAHFALTGAHFRVTLALPGGAREPVEHAAVGFAPAGARLEFGPRLRGFRGYLCVAPCSSGKADRKLLKRRRGAFREVFSWPDPLGRIRLLAGPEQAWLADPGAFFRQHWQVTGEVSDMGLRLAGSALPLARERNMVSDAVADGTVQLTPKGPIILLRHRQTVGGYPRIFNAISADLDLLAQCGPERLLRFRQVELAEALAVERLKQRELAALRARFSGRGT